jgi:hypothetical protein
MHALLYKARKPLEVIAGDRKLPPEGGLLWLQKSGIDRKRLNVLEKLHRLFSARTVPYDFPWRAAKVCLMKSNPEGIRVLRVDHYLPGSREQG